MGVNEQSRQSVDNGSLMWTYYILVRVLIVDVCRLIRHSSTATSYTSYSSILVRSYYILLPGLKITDAWRLMKHTVTSTNETRDLKTYNAPAATPSRVHNRTLVMLGFGPHTELLGQVWDLKLLVYEDLRLPGLEDLRPVTLSSRRHMRWRTDTLVP